MSRHNTSTSKISEQYKLVSTINCYLAIMYILKSIMDDFLNIFSEKANLAVTIENEKKEVLAQATFLDYPNVKGVDQSQWETWIRRYSQSGKCTAMNTLFLHLFVTNSHYPIGCIKEIIRIEDHDELNSIFIKHSDTLRLTYGDFFLAELIEAQDDHNHAAVCEVKSSAVGFVSVCSDVNVNLLVQCFDLRPFHNFAKVPRKVESVASLEPDAISGMLIINNPYVSYYIEGQVTEESTETITQSVITTEVAQPPNVFCIQLFCINDEYESRDYCVITVPHVVPEFPLLKEFVRITPYSNTTLPHELYIDGIPIQAFVAVVLDEIVGVAIVRNEEDIEYIRSHYNIEDFIYFNHHKREEHGHLYHFAVNPIFNHFSRHFLKEILRLSHKSCLYYPIHMASSLKKVKLKQGLKSSPDFWDKTIISLLIVNEQSLCNQPVTN
uniref:Cilia- and flagella-associated protein 61 N-terminal domain-containing protein n=1 Tax=Callorhinchus milii TaxID=7868 RepID=A0A4W3K0T3_CALMI